MEYTDKEYCLEVWGDYACFTRPRLPFRHPLRQTSPEALPMSEFRSKFGHPQRFKR